MSYKTVNEVRLEKLGKVETVQTWILKVTNLWEGPFTDISSTLLEWKEAG